MSDVVCPECDEPIALKKRESRVKCPACGTNVAVPESLRREPGDKAEPTPKRKASKPKDADEDEAPRPRRKRRFGDDPDDEKPRESKARGWLFITVVIVAVLGLGVFVAISGINWIRDKFDDSPRVKAPFTVDPNLERATGPVYLADMTEFDVIAGPWPFTKGELGDPEHKPIQVNGVISRKGLSMHPGDRQMTRAAYALGGKATSLRGTVALNDSQPDAFDPVVFTVLGDRKELWKSKPIKRVTGPEAFKVNVRNVKILELRVTAQGSHWGAHAVWIDPVLEN